MSRSRAKGTAFETLILGGFQTVWPQAHRPALLGNRDEGDIWLPEAAGLVVEAKSQSNYHGRLSTWLAEAQAEAANADRPHPIVVHKRMGKGRWQDQYVTCDLATFLGVMERINGTDRGGPRISWR